MISYNDIQATVRNLRSIVFLEDDETGEEYCEVEDLLNALGVSPDLGEYLFHRDIDRMAELLTANRKPAPIWPEMLPFRRIAQKRFRIDSKRVKTWLVENDIAQKDLAEAIGVEPTTVGNWINKPRDVRMSHVFALSEATGIDVYDLVEEIDG